VKSAVARRNSPVNVCPQCGIVQPVGDELYKHYGVQHKKVLEFYFKKLQLEKQGEVEKNEVEIVEVRKKGLWRDVQTYFFEQGLAGESPISPILLSTEFFDSMVGDSYLSLGTMNMVWTKSVIRKCVLKMDCSSMKL
jgi:hypothetical protein